MQTLLFQACLPTPQNGVENRDKAYCSLIVRYLLVNEPMNVTELISICQYLRKTDVNNAIK